MWTRRCVPANACLRPVRCRRGGGGVCAARYPTPVSLAAEPVADEFYTPPTRLSGKRPGEVIRAELIAAPPGATAWRVLYRSETVAGHGVAVSGCA